MSFDGLRVADAQVAQVMTMGEEERLALAADPATPPELLGALGRWLYDGAAQLRVTTAALGNPNLDFEAMNELIEPFVVVREPLSKFQSGTRTTVLPMPDAMAQALLANPLLAILDLTDPQWFARVSNEVCAALCATPCVAVRYAEGFALFAQGALATMGPWDLKQRLRDALACAGQTERATALLGPAD